jgi:hypothetical protein
MNPMKESSNPDYKPVANFKVSNASTIIRGGIMNADKTKVAKINWNYSDTPLVAKSQYGKDFQVARVFIARDETFKEYHSKFLGEDGKVREASWGDISSRDSIVLSFNISNIWKTTTGIVITLNVLKALVLPTKKEAKVEFKGKLEVAPTLDELARLVGKTCEEPQEAVADIPVFDDEGDDATGIQEGYHSPKPKAEDLKRKSEEEFPSPEPVKKSKKAKKTEEDF